MKKLWQSMFRAEQYSEITLDAQHHSLKTLTIADFNYLGLSALASQSLQWFEAVSSDPPPPELAPYFNLYLGATYYQMHEYDKASELIESCRPIIAGKGHVFNGIGCSWLRGVNSYTQHIGTAQATILATPELIFQSPHEQISVAKLCFLASADTAYFTKFSSGLIRSFLEYRNDESALLICIINPSDDAKFWVAEHKSELAVSGVFFAHTFGPDNKTYYASSRFLLAPQLLELLDCGVFHIDVDTLFTAPTRTLSLGIEHLDAAFTEQDWRLPWQKCQAGKVFMGNTPAGHLMAEVISTYCKTVYNEALDQWFLDQNGLEYYRRTIELDPSINFVNLHEIPEIRDVLFSPTGSKKKALEGKLF